MITDGGFATFRDAARAALAANLAPAEASFDHAQASLFAPAPVAPTDVRVPSHFVKLAQVVALHRSPTRWRALYRVLWRITHGEHALLRQAADPDVRALDKMVSAIRRDIHKLHAFVRFRKLDLDDGPLWVAFYRPDHLVLAQATPHFVARMGDQPFLITTPDGAARWDCHQLTFADPAPAELVAAAAGDPSEDHIESLFVDYYKSVFNPARLNLSATTKEMPKRFWKHIPEAREVAKLAAAAPMRTGAMIESNVSVAVVSASLSLPVLHEAAARCTACDIHCHATQTVFGEGPSDARIVLIGEQPGDEEDRAGHPFIGPAGRLLRELAAEANFAMDDAYVTNAVKHFKWEPRGKRRIHSKPAYREVRACHPWLEAELRAVKPDVIVCLGVTAAQSLLGSGFRLAQGKGKLIPQPWARAMLTTYHPSAILRMEGAAADEARAQLIGDLRRARQIAAQEATLAP